MRALCLRGPGTGEVIDWPRGVGRRRPRTAGGDLVRSTGRPFTGSTSSRLEPALGRTLRVRSGERSADQVPHEPPGTLRLSPGPPAIQREEAPIESEREVEPRLTLRPDVLQLTLDMLHGRHRFELEGGVTQPLNLLGETFPGIPPSRVSAALRYETRCNEAFQRAALEFEQNQRRGGPLFDLETNPWRVGGRVGFRRGSVVLEPGLQLGFQGSRFDTFLFALTVTTGASTDTPRRCIAPEPEAPGPEPTPEPSPEPTPEQAPGPEGERVPGPETDPTPPPSPVQLTSVTLHFFYDSHLVRPESHEMLERVQDTLLGIPRLEVHLVGHTSLEGSEEYNLRLGQQRADAIRDRLVLAGVDRSRVRTFSMGEYAPAETEPDRDERSLLPAVEEVRTRNRRVEIIFLDPEGELAPAVPPTTLRTRRLGPMQGDGT